MKWVNDNLMCLSYDTLKNFRAGKSKYIQMKKLMSFQCAYCGGVYSAAFGFDEISYSRADSQPLHMTYCQLCRIITRYTPKQSNMVMMCESDIAQIDIIRMTVEFIITNKQHPTISDIDPHAGKPRKMSSKFARIENGTHKIFYISHLDIANILNNKAIDPTDCFSSFEINDTQNAALSIQMQRDVDTANRIQRWYTKMNINMMSFV